MKKNVYVVYDKLQERWNDPVFMNSIDNEECDKTWSVSIFREMRNKQSDVYKNADDLDLYHIGVYDDKTGSFDLLDPKRLVLHYSSLKGD